MGCASSASAEVITRVRALARWRSRCLRHHLFLHALAAQAIDQGSHVRAGLQTFQVPTQTLADVGADEWLITGKAKPRRNPLEIIDGAVSSFNSTSLAGVGQQCKQGWSQN